MFPRLQPFHTPLQGRGEFSLRLQQSHALIPTSFPSLAHGCTTLAPMHSGAAHRGLPSGHLEIFELLQMISRLEEIKSLDSVASENGILLY